MISNHNFYNFKLKKYTSYKDSYQYNFMLGK